VLLAPTLLLGGLVAVRAWRLHVTTGQYQFIQGRYLFAGIVGSVVVVAAGVQAVVPRRWCAPAVLVAGGALQLEALRLVLAGYWGGPGLGPRGQVRALVAWSAWPGWMVAAIAVAAAASAAWLAVEVVREVLRVPVDDPGAVGEVR
jgi:hypothetical protein